VSSIVYLKGGINSGLMKDTSLHIQVNLNYWSGLKPLFACLFKSGVSFWNIWLFWVYNFNMHMKKPTTVLTFSYIFLSMQSLKYNFESPNNLVIKWCVQSCNIPWSLSNKLFLFSFHLQDLTCSSLIDLRDSEEVSKGLKTAIGSKQVSCHICVSMIQCYVCGVNVNNTDGMIFIVGHHFTSICEPMLIHNIVVYLIQNDRFICL